MKQSLTAILIGLGIIVILALILAIKAFAWVFATIFHYGLIALVIVAIIAVIIKFRIKNKKNQ